MHLVFLLTFCVMLSVSTAFAESNSERASQLYRQGAEEYLRGNFVEALALYRQGYDLEPDGMFLYNISLVYGKLDNYPEALNYAERAQREGLPDEAWARNMPRINAYQIILKAQKIVVEKDLCRSDSDCDSGFVCEASTSSCVEVKEELPVSKVEPVAKPTWLGWTGAGLFVGGGVLIALGVVTDGEVSQMVRDYDRLRLAGDQESAQQKADEITEAQTRGKIFLYSGIGVALAGAGLFVFDMIRDVESDVAVLPVFDSHSAGVSISGAF